MRVCHIPGTETPDPRHAKCRHPPETGRAGAPETGRAGAPDSPDRGIAGWGMAEFFPLK